jgi:hypothetical protein
LSGDVVGTAALQLAKSMPSPCSNVGYDATTWHSLHDPIIMPHTFRPNMLLVVGLDMACYGSIGANKGSAGEMGWYVGWNKEKWNDVG